MLRAIRINKQSLVTQHRAYNDFQFHTWTWNDVKPTYTWVQHVVEPKDIGSGSLSDTCIWAWYIAEHKDVGSDSSPNSYVLGLYT
jgi:hypothetical protein